MLFTARRTFVFTTLAVTQSQVFTAEQRELFLEESEAQFKVIYDDFPIGVLPVLSMGIQNIWKDPDLFVEKLFDFFEKNPDNIIYFTSLTFPAIFFYFQAKEFLDMGYHLLMKAIEIKRNLVLTRCLSAFFDSFPAFVNSLVENFARLAMNEEVTVLFALRDALKISFRLLTVYHRNLVKKLMDIDMNYLCEFIFMSYLQPRMLTWFTFSNEQRVKEVEDELSTLLDFCTFGATTVHVKLILDAILGVDNFQDNMIEYKETLGTRTVWAPISSFEVAILFPLLIFTGHVKDTGGQFSKLQFPKATSLAPGVIQYQLDPWQKREKMEFPLIFENITEEEPEGFPSHFKTTYAQLKSLSQEYGQTVRELLTEPKPQAQRSIEGYDVLKSTEFADYLTSRSRCKLSRAERRFECFMDRLFGERRIQDVAKEFQSELYFYIQCAAKQFVMAECLENNTVQPVCRKKDLPSCATFLFTLYPFLKEEPRLVTGYEQVITVKDSFRSLLMDQPHEKKILDYFQIQFSLSLLDAWKGETPDCFKQLFDYMNKLGKLLFAMGAFSKYRMNRFVHYLVQRVQDAQALPQGALFNLMWQIIPEIETIRKEFYSSVSFEIVFRDIVLMSGNTGVWACVILFNKLKRMYEQSFKQGSYLWEKVSDYLFAMIKEKDIALWDTIQHNITEAQ